MRTALMLILPLCISIPLVAQEQKSRTPKEIKTKIEAFEAKTGAVIIRGFSHIGVVSGRFHTLVRVQIREFTDASSSKKEYGIFITVKEFEKFERENSSYIDYDEIDSLLKGTDYVAKVQKTVTKLDSFQADYKTRGEFTVSTYTNDEDKIMASVQSGGIGGTEAYLRLDDLVEFRRLIERAKAELDSIRK